MCGTHMLLVVIIRQRAASTEAEAEHLHNNKPCSPIYCCSVVEAIPLDWNFCQPHGEWGKGTTIKILAFQIAQIKRKDIFG